MKKIKKTFKILLATLFIFVACTDQLTDLSFTENIALPTNVSAAYNITQDNSGLVTITPIAQGATNFDIHFGDATPDPTNINQGESVQHTYTEGTYSVKVVAFNIKGKSTEVVQELIISFKAPENLIATIENDAAISKQVNITATADFASMFEFHSGETGVIQTVVTGNIGETISYQYTTPGTYTIKVIAKGGAIQTTEYTVDFEVTEILAPINAAPNPPNRAPQDVISLFSDKYTDVTLSELPTSWSSSGFEATTVGTNAIWKLTNIDFIGMVTNYTSGIDVSSMEKLHIDYWVPDGRTNELLVKIVNTIDGGEDIESLGTTVGGSWQSIDIDMTGFDGGNLANKEKITQILIDSDGVAGVVYIDNFYFYRASTVTTTFDDGILTNGDFENGSDSWTIGVDENTSAPVETNGGNTYYSVNVTSAGNVFDVNVSQKVEIIEGNTYTLTFDAWSDVNRTIVAGIGLSADPWTNTGQPLNITTTRTTYSFTYSTVGFGAENARVLFDLGGEVGLVNIDNVSLIIGTGNILTNGDFENGSDSWTIGVDESTSAPVETNGGNTYYSVNVTSAGNVFDVNVSQKVEIIEGNTYTLTFDAWSDVNRTIVAGIGLSADPWTNTGQPLNITTTRTTYSFTYSTVGFGAENARVLFDLGGEVGLVNIDDVSLSIN